MRFWIAIYLAGAASTCAPLPAFSITLEEAINTALSGNRDMAAMEIELNGRALSAEQARYRFAFTVRPIAGANLQSSSELLRYGVVGAKVLPVGSEIETGVRVDQAKTENTDTAQFGAVYVQLRQPLFRDWGLLANREPIELADSSFIAGRRMLELRKNDIVVQVVEIYQDLLRLHRLAEFEQRALERYDRLLRLTRAREKQGRATAIDGLRVEYLRGQAESRLAGTREQARSLAAEFADLLGTNDSAALIPEEMADLSWSLPPRDEALQLAFSNRLDLAQAMHDHEDQRRGVRIAEKRVRPGLELITRYERLGGGRNWRDTWGLDDEVWTIGLRSDSDLFLRNERLELRQAALNERSGVLLIEDVEALIRRQIDQSLSAGRRALQEQQIAESNLELATKRAFIAQRLYERGRIDQTAATDAEMELLDARTEALNARANAVVASYRLWRAMGLLLDIPDELKPAFVLARK
jgi:outer membrane protein TolC